jgi:hypothetical protein
VELNEFKLYGDTTQEVYAIHDKCNNLVWVVGVTTPTLNNLIKACEEHTCG